MARKKTRSVSSAKSRTRTKRAKVKKRARKKAARGKNTAAKAKFRTEGGAEAFLEMANDANVTSDQIVDQATAAANEFNDPIEKLGSVEEPNQAQRDCLRRMQGKQAEIMEEAAKQILDLPVMAQALDRLRTATTNLNEVAQQMVDVTAVLAKANKFVGFGNDAVNAIKSVTA